MAAASASSALFKTGDSFTVKIVNITYCGVIAEYTFGDKTYWFSMEKFPQNPKQNTLPPQDIERKPDFDLTGFTHDEALAYWVSAYLYNADGTRKGGAFSAANFGLHPAAQLNTELFAKVTATSAHNITLELTALDDVTFKAYACHNPSPQYAVDTVILTIHKGQFYVRVIKRAAAGPDYPNGFAIIGGFLDGNKTVEQGRNQELTEEGGNVIGMNRTWEYFLGERNEDGRDPRYKPFTYTTSDGDMVTFGYDRGSTAHAVAHVVVPCEPSDDLPKLAKATDTAEVVGGVWFTVDEFLAMSNDPADQQYVPWIDHQKVVKYAVEYVTTKLPDMVCKNA
jgi:ADP-ribose pyrophosphatase YjhB (NUDIX family)